MALDALCPTMATASQKLRALARQSRTLSSMVSDRKRAQSLIALASLYERQALEIEASEPELLTA